MSQDRCRPEVGVWPWASLHTSLHAVCGVIRHRRSRGSWGKDSEAHFHWRGQESWRSAKSQVQRMTVRFHFISWKQPNCTEGYPTQVRRNNRKPQIIGLWTAAEFKPHFLCDNQKNSEDRNQHMPQNTQSKPQGQLRQCHGVACEGTSELPSKGLLIEPAKTNCQ